MKILLDEGIDVHFRRDFPAHHDVFIVHYMERTGVKNGALLRLLEEHHFDCWITVDKSIPHQQNVAKFPCLVVVLDVASNDLPYLQAVLPNLLKILDAPPAERLVVIRG